MDDIISCFALCCYDRRNRGGRKEERTFRFDWFRFLTSELTFCLMLSVFSSSMSFCDNTQTKRKKLGHFLLKRHRWSWLDLNYHQARLSLVQAGDRFLQVRQAGMLEMILKCIKWNHNYVERNNGVWNRTFLRANEPGDILLTNVSFSGLSGSLTDGVLETTSRGGEREANGNQYHIPVTQH